MQCDLEAVNTANKVIKHLLMYKAAYPSTKGLWPCRGRGDGVEYLRSLKELLRGPQTGINRSRGEGKKNEATRPLHPALTSTIIKNQALKMLGQE